MNHAFMKQKYLSNQGRAPHEEYRPAQPAAYISPLLLPTQSSTHDMSKTVQAVPSGMYQTSSGAIPGTAAQHHQAGMGGPTPPTSLVQGQPINPRSHLTNIVSYQTRQNPSHSMPNMSRPPMANVINQSTPQAPQQYPAHVQMLPSHASFQPAPLTHQMYVTAHGQLAQLYPQRPPPAYSQQQYSQAMFYYNNAPAPNNVFYSMQHVPPSCPPSMNQMQQLPQAPKKEKKILSIVNPATGKNIFEPGEDTAPEENKVNTTSGYSSSPICMQFAAQVAATLASDKKSSKTLDEEKLVDTRPVIHPNNLSVVDNIEKSGNSDAEISNVCERYNEEEIFNASESSAVYCNNDNVDVHSVNDCNSMSSETKLECDEIKSISLPDSVNLINHEIHNITDNSETCIESTTTVNTEEVISKLSEDTSETRPVVYNNKMQADMDDDIVNQSVNQSASLNTQIETNDVKQISSDVQQEIQVAEEIQQSASIVKVEKPPVETRKGKKTKKKDLNKKGESKEGGDMDAFLDKSVENTPLSCSPVATSPVSPITVQKLEPEANETKELNLIPVSSEIKTSEINGTDTFEPVVDSISPEENPEKKKEETPLQEPPKITLIYNYKEDQWSPLNPEGKKQYDREFLLELQSQPMSLKKPSNLPNLDVIKDKAQIHRLSDVIRVPPVAIPTRTYADPFMPPYARAGAPRPPHPGLGRRSQQGREKQKKTISFGCSLRENIKLHESENAWKPSHKNESDDIEEGRTQELYKKVRGILNKLTPQKFETLVGQVKQLDITTEERLNGVIDLVFEKAIDEPNFSVSYANMCKQLALLKVPSSGQEGQYVNFRKLLLTKCQREFERDRSDELKREERMKLIEECDTEEKRKQLQEECEEEETKNRRRQLGNIRFIGELFKLGMLIEPIMHECIKKLLSQGDADSLECLTRLLTTIGKELETDKKSREMDNYFAIMQRIVDKRQTSSRVRFMLQDLIDLRKNKWIPRRDENNPKTIEQIHKEAEQEAHEQQQMLQNMPFVKRMPDDRDRRKGGTGSGRTPTYEDGWITSNKSSKGNYALDPLKLKLTKPAEVESIQLGPGGKGFTSWSRGSSGGTKTPSNESNNKTSAVLTNRYSALADSNPLPNYEARRGSQRSAASSRESSRGRNSHIPPPSIRKTPSVSKEREQLLETVKGLARSTQNEQKTEEVKVPDTQSVNGKELSVLLKGVDLPEEVIEKKTQPLIDEFLHNSDFEEAIQCITELASPSTVHILIRAAINQVLERSSQARYLLGQLLHNLVVRKIITMEQYNKGLELHLELVDDFAVDIPKIWEYFGEIIEPMVDGSCLKFLKDTLQPCIPSLKAGKLVSAVLHCAAKKRGTIKVGDLWRSSGLEWEDFLGASENISDFIKTQKLEFTVSQMKSEPNKELSAAEIKKKLDFYLKNGTDNNEEIFDWIESYVGEERINEPSFIRALVTAIHESAIAGSGAKCEFYPDVLKKRLPLLLRYVAHKEDAELQALYAVQALINKLDQPKGVLRQIFDCLYDDDIINEEVFKKWEVSTDPAEQEGKGVALLSVASFFTWLREADDETSGEDG